MLIGNDFIRARYSHSHRSAKCQWMPNEEGLPYLYSIINLYFDHLSAKRQNVEQLSQEHASSNLMSRGWLFHQAFENRCFVELYAKIHSLDFRHLKSPFSPSICWVLARLWYVMENQSDYHWQTTHKSARKVKPLNPLSIILLDHLLSACYPAKLKTRKHESKSQASKFQADTRRNSAFQEKSEKTWWFQQEG